MTGGVEPGGDSPEGGLFATGVVAESPPHPVKTPEITNEQKAKRIHEAAKLRIVRPHHLTQPGFRSRFVVPAVAWRWRGPSKSHTERRASSRARVARRAPIPDSNPFRFCSSTEQRRSEVQCTCHRS